jgi:uncharacterized membrane protein YbhN (UPF0104 family)
MASLSEKELPDPPQPNWGFVGELAKYSGMLAIIILAIVVLRRKLAHITLVDIWDGLQTIPPHQILLAVLVTCINFVVLTGYDLIAVRYLRKDLPISKVMQGAIIGYALSNVLGWLLGGTAVRYRLYTSWGFKFVEVVAFVSILSVTFWLGMFMLAGIAFAILPVKLPERYAEALHFPLHSYGYVFLFFVAVYLGLTLFARKPMRIGTQQFSFPPFRMSLLQLAVSATDFVLASLVLFVLLPPGLVNYPTVLVSYLAAMIVVVFLHVPGGIGVLEAVILSLLADESDTDHAIKKAVVCALILYRVIYYLIPAAVATVMYLLHEADFKKHRRRLKQQTQLETQDPSL